jgi:ABC-type glycerol-3-phosphate transport system substrate-binding protein
MHLRFLVAGSPVLSFAALLFLSIAGCRPGVDQTGSVTNGELVEAKPLTILVVDDEPLADVVERQWRARSTGEVTVHRISSHEILTANAKISGDAIIYPAGLLGELVERDLIQPVPDAVLENPDLGWRDVLTFDRGPLVTWSNTVYAFSFGSPSLTLMYRRDIFERLAIKPPSTWREYHDVANRLDDSAELGDLRPAPQERWSGTAEPLAPGWAGQLLLARAAPYARRRSNFSTLFNYETMQPLIDRQPFVRALDELVAAAEFGPESHAELSPDAVRAALMRGECAMALTWPVREFEPHGDNQGSNNTGSISFAIIPGTTEVFTFGDEQWKSRPDDEDITVPLLAVAGRLGSVTRDARNSRGAWNMLATLTGKSLSREISPRSRYTTIFRTSHLAAPEDWTAPTMDAESARNYAELVQIENECINWLFSMRIPGREEYLAALDDAVNSALAREKSSAEALESAARRWQEITESRGVENQRKAYARSLGL